MKKNLFTLFCFLSFSTFALQAVNFSATGSNSASNENVLFAGGCEVDFDYETDGSGTVLFDANTSGGDASTYSWDFGDGSEGDGESPDHHYTEPGTYTVCVIVTFDDGCVADFCSEVIVEIAGGDCSGSFEVTATDGLNIHFFGWVTPDFDVVTYTWYWDDGTTTTETGSSDGSDPWHEYTEPGTYHVCLVIETGSGCTDEYCSDVIVESGGSGDCTASVESTGTSGLAVHVFASVDPEFDIVNYTITWGDGTSSTYEASSDGVDPWHEYDEPGTYEICVHIETGSGCTDEACIEIIVEEPSSDCSASFEYEISDAGAVHFFASTEPGPGDVDSYWWSFGDGTFGDGDDPWHEYAETGEYDVCLVVTFVDGCVAEYCYTIYVEVPGGGGDCESFFELESECLTVHFFEGVSGVEVDHYSWDFGDGSESDDANPGHEYAEAGTYEVCLTIVTADGCEDTYCASVTVEDCGSDCFAEFNWDADGLTIFFTASTDPGPGDVTSYFWDFGDGTEGDGIDPDHEYAEEGVYIVCLTVTFADGCVAEYCNEIHVSGGGGGGSDCEADFNVLSVEPDGTGWNVVFNNESFADAGIGEVIWYFGDGEVAYTYDAEHHYDAPGEYNVCVVIISEDGECTDEHCETITVGESDGECEADFEWSDDGLTVEYNSTSDDGGSLILTYVWSFDDGTFSFDENPVHVYDAAGEYEVCLSIITFDSCFDTHCETIHIEDDSDPCEAYFIVSSITETDEGWVVNFNNESIGSEIYHWTFGDGGTSDASDPEHHYTEPGIYTVCLTIGEEGSDCFDEYCTSIFIGGDDDCINETVIDTTIGCPDVYEPVCGCDGVTYDNECDAHYYHGVLFWTSGACATGIDEEKIASLMQVYPNPASYALNIDLNTFQSGEVNMSIKDLLGNTVMYVFDGKIISGETHFTVDVSVLPGGVYFVHATVNNAEQVNRKFIITKE